MQPEEVVALGELAGATLTGITGHVEGVHKGIARRVWAAVGPLATPVRVVHDTIAAGVYGGMRRTLELSARSGARALSFSVSPEAPSLQAGRGGRLAVGVLNGAIGDTLHREGNSLALSMTLRQNGRDLELSRDSLRTAFPDATPKLVVFVHGLGETDDVWWTGSSERIPYGVRLRAELGFTPLYVRYNSGRGVDAGARELASLLHAVALQWPLEVQQFVLIGHGMGGLVASSACQHASGQSWSGKVAEVLTLGSPQWGAPVERLVALATGLLGRLGETEALARTLSGRSAGVKELRSGHASSPPRGRQHALDYRRLSAVRHFDLVNEPEIYEQIRALLSSRPALPAPRRDLPPPQRP
jgi:pimeloyl-ACP methyl ester carboxylesterase